jgi:hypothetical protein
MSQHTITENLMNVQKEVEETFSHIKPKATILTPWPGGSRQAQKKTQVHKKERSFHTNTQKYKSGRAAWKGTKSQHCCLGGVIGVPRGACYKCGRKKMRNHFASLLVALQPLGRKGTRRTGREQGQAHRPPPSCFGKHDGDTNGWQRLP